MAVGLLVVFVLWACVPARIPKVGIRVGFDEQTTAIAFVELDTALARRTLLVPLTGQEQSKLNQSPSKSAEIELLAQWIKPGRCVLYDRQTGECSSAAFSEAPPTTRVHLPVLLFYPRNDRGSTFQPSTHDELRKWIEYTDHSGNSHRLQTRGFARSVWVAVRAGDQPEFKNAVAIGVRSAGSGHYTLPMGGSRTEFGGPLIFEFFLLRQDAAHVCFSLREGLLPDIDSPFSMMWGSDDAKLWVIRSASGFYLVDLNRVK